MELVIKSFILFGIELNTMWIDLGATRKQLSAPNTPPNGDSFSLNQIYFYNHYKYTIA